jgi:hypothetical protein
MGLGLGNSIGGYGEVSVTGGLWRISEQLWSGMYGRGSFTIGGGEMRFLNGGPVLAIGLYAGSTGEVTIAGGMLDMGGNGDIWMGRVDSGSVPLLRASSAFIAPSNVTVPLNGHMNPFLNAKFVEAGGQQVLSVSYFGTMILVL